MALKAKLSKDAWSKLPEVLQAEYAEKDGSYFLSVTAVDGLSLEDANSPTGARTALQKERDLRKAAEDKVKAFGDLDPEAAAAAVTKLAELGDLSKLTHEEKVRQLLDQHSKQFTDKHKRELDTRDATIKGLNGQLEKVLVHNAATAAIAKAKGRLKALLPLVKGAIRLEKDSTSGELVARVFDPDTGIQLVTKREGRHEPMTIDEYVDGMRSDPELEGNFDAHEASGSGKEPNPKKDAGGGRSTVKTVSANDPDAMGDNIDAIASGDVVVVNK